MFIGGKKWAHKVCLFFFIHEENFGKSNPSASSQRVSVAFNLAIWYRVATILNNRAQSHQYRQEKKFFLALYIHSRHSSHACSTISILLSAMPHTNKQTRMHTRVVQTHGKSHLVFVWKWLIIVLPFKRFSYWDQSTKDLPIFFCLFSNYPNAHSVIVYRKWL